MRLHPLKIMAVAVAIIVITADAAFGSTLLYTPVNPTFGGNPLNGPTVLVEGQAQNQFTNKPPSSAATPATQTPGQLFASQLTSQLYSSLANQITQAIFGANAQTSGTFSFQGTTITFQRVNGEILISVFDGTTTTNITVPATSP
jgi:curli production assembly/transport component CsgF